MTATANVYLSGRFTVNTKVETAWLKRTGCKHRCFSFAFVNEAKPIPGFFNKKCVEALHVCEKAKVKIMMDSGAFSLHTLMAKSSKKGAKAFDLEATRKKMFESYVKFCQAHKEKWEFYVTLDFKKDQAVIYEMQREFLKHALEPMPVYHGADPLEWLKKHKDMGHNYICIGGGRLHPGKEGLRYYFDNIFNYGAKYGIEYHGLAFTNMDGILSWPFKSVDSSTWSRTAAYGMILIPDVRRRKFLNLHVSSRFAGPAVHSHHDMSKKQKESLRELIAFHDFDLDAMADSEVERHDWNGYMMSHLSKFGVEHTPKRTWDNLL